MKTEYKDRYGEILEIESDENGWIVWWGNAEAPLEGLVETELADLTQFTGDASQVVWKTTTNPKSVVVYRPVEDKFIWKLGAMK